MPKSHSVSRAVAAILSPMLAVGLALPAYSQTREGSRSDKSTPEKIYHNYCSVCHGDKGDGRSRAQNSFIRPPKDFTKTDPKSLPRDYMVAIVRDGKAGTAMVGWKTQLTEKEIDQVVDYVRTKFMGVGSAPAEVPKAPAGAVPAQAPKVAAAAGASPDSTALEKHMAMPFPKGLKGDAKAGGAFYMKNCATCHGEKGDGKGPRAYFINPKPRNFLDENWRAQFNRPLLFQVTAKGKLGTEMPAWDKVLTEQEIANVAEFVFVTFVRSPKAEKTAR
jgi:mono/diheme cytochrome c family protein